MRPYFLLALISPLLSAVPLQAAPPASCESSLFYFDYTSCAAPSHGQVYIDAPNINCGAATFKLCPVNRQFTTDELRFYGHFNEQNPGDHAGEVNCMIQIKTRPDQINARYETAWANYLSRWPLANSTKNPPLESIGQALAAAPQTINLIIGRRDYEECPRQGGCGSNWWAMSCAYTVTFDLKIKDRDPSCGAETYKSCRDPANGVAANIVKKSSACPLDSSHFFLAPSDQLSRPAPMEGKLVCPTANEMPARNADEVQKKIVALRANLETIKNAKGVGGPNAMARTQVQILLELDRQIRVYNSDSEELKALEAHISELMPNLEPAFDSLAAIRSTNALKSIAAIYPDQIQALSQKYRRTFADLSDVKYIALFPNGIILKGSELVNAVNSVETLDPSKNYRVAEAIVRSTLADANEIQMKIVKLIAFRAQFPGTSQELAKMIATISSVRNLSASDAASLQDQWQALLNDQQKLRAAVGSFINSQVKSLEQEKSIKMTELWSLVARLDHSDPRFPVLKGYKALVELDALGFRRALNQGLEKLKDSSSYEEARQSLVFLESAAHGEIGALRDLESLLDAPSSKQNSLVNLIFGIAAKQNIADDKLTDLLSEALDGLNGEAGAEIAFRLNLQSAVATVYDGFISAMDNLPGLYK